jgi:hypothetical protein
VKIRLGNGDTVYEGFVTALPRSTDGQSHTLSVSCAGWMSHAADTPFTEIFVDRDLSQWGAMGRARRAAAIGGGVKLQEPIGRPDPTSGTAVVVTPISETWTTTVRVETWYDAGPGNLIGAIYYEWAKTGAAFGTIPGNWQWFVFVSSDDAATAFESTANLAAAGPGSGTLTPVNRYRFAFLYFQNGAAGGAAGATFEIDWSKLAVYGDHGLALIGSSAPLGVAASDVIKYLANTYAPLLNTSGVQATSYPISHLVFRESTKPYDAWLKVNSYHLWQLAVWENRTLYYEPVDLTDWDWEIRHDEVGNQIGLQGDELTSLRNGIIVQYTNAATGAVDVLMPADHPELRDDTIDNPYTAHGRSAYGDPFIVPFPTTAADALELGRLQLIEDNQPKAPGSFQVTGQIKDRAGNYQPVSKVRAGDRIRLTSSMNLSDRPRLIQETSYSHDGLTATISVDSTLRYLEGYLDRVQTALAAANLSS